METEIDYEVSAAEKFPFGRYYPYMQEGRCGDTCSVPRRRNFHKESRYQGVESKRAARQWIELLFVSSFFLLVAVGCKGSVEMVRWEIREQAPYDDCGCTMLIKCETCLKPVIYWSGGDVEVFREPTGCCYVCERNARDEILGIPSCTRDHILRFNSSNTPYSRIIDIPPHKPRPGLVVYTRNEGINPRLTRDLCRIRYTSSELQGDRLHDLESFLETLVIRYGGDADLSSSSNNPRDVCILVSTAEPEVRYDDEGRRGYVAGAISCASGAAARGRNCRYQIILWEKAFSRGNVCAQEPYNVVAHELKHILQSIHLQLPISRCNQVTERQETEEEANTFAEMVAPSCDDCLAP